MENEIWINVNNEYHDYYMVSNFGRIKKTPRKIYKKHTGNIQSCEQQGEKILKTHKYCGYLKVFFYCKNIQSKSKCYSIHRLVLESFNLVPNMKNLQVNHIDGNKENNKLDNLELVTPKENIRHAINNCLFTLRDQNGEKNHIHKLTEEQVLEIVELSKQNLKYVEMAKLFNVDPQTISDIIRGRHWSWLTKIQKKSLNNRL